MASKKTKPTAKFGKIAGGHKAVLEHHGWKKVHEHEDISVWHHPKHGGYAVHEDLGTGTTHLHHGIANGGMNSHLNDKTDHAIHDHHELDSHLGRYHAAEEKGD